jgi:hypothetical protein
MWLEDHQRVAAGAVVVSRRRVTQHLTSNENAAPLRTLDRWHSARSLLSPDMAEETMASRTGADEASRGRGRIHGAPTALARRGSRIARRSWGPITDSL